MYLACVSLVVSYDQGLNSLDGHAAVSQLRAQYALHSCPRVFRDVLDVLVRSKIYPLEYAMQGLSACKRFMKSYNKWRW